MDTDLAGKEKKMRERTYLELKLRGEVNLHGT